VAADLKFLGDLHLGVFARAQQGAGFFQVVIGQGFGPASDTAAPPGGLKPGIDTLAQDIALEFCQRREQMEGQLAARRCGVDVLGEGMGRNAGNIVPREVQYARSATRPCTSAMKSSKTATSSSSPINRGTSTKTRP
jgi:hypothetical protein